MDFTLEYDQIGLVTYLQLKKFGDKLKENNLEKPKISENDENLDLPTTEKEINAIKSGKYILELFLSSCYFDIKILSLECILNLLKQNRKLTWKYIFCEKEKEFLMSLWSSLRYWCSLLDSIFKINSEDLEMKKLISKLELFLSVIISGVILTKIKREKEKKEVNSNNQAIDPIKEELEEYVVNLCGKIDRFSNPKLISSLLFHIIEYLFGRVFEKGEFGKLNLLISNFKKILCLLRKPDFQTEVITLIAVVFSLICIEFDESKTLQKMQVEYTTYWISRMIIEENFLSMFSDITKSFKVFDKFIFSPCLVFIQSMNYIIKSFLDEKQRMFDKEVINAMFSERNLKIIFSLLYHKDEEFRKIPINFYFNASLNPFGSDYSTAKRLLKVLGEKYFEKLKEKCEKFKESKFFIELTLLRFEVYKNSQNGESESKICMYCFKGVVKDYQIEFDEQCKSSGIKNPFFQLRKCGNCKYASYCSKECQKADWESHKDVCESMKLTKKLKTKMDIFFEKKFLSSLIKKYVIMIDAKFKEKKLTIEENCDNAIVLLDMIFFYRLNLFIEETPCKVKEIDKKKEKLYSHEEKQHDDLPCHETPCEVKEIDKKKEKLYSHEEKQHDDLTGNEGSLLPRIEVFKNLDLLKEFLLKNYNEKIGTSFFPKVVPQSAKRYVRTFIYGNVIGISKIDVDEFKNLVIYEKKKINDNKNK